MTFKTTASVLAAAASVLSAPVFASPTLRVGDSAPPIEVMKWLKGAPVPELKKGHVYLVEFWSIGCGPCVQMMPHLTELAKRYTGRATVIGIHCEVGTVPLDTQKESVGRYVAKIERFVKKKGSLADYPLAIDDPVARPMNDNWFMAAGLNAIPSTFIVDRSGTVVAIDPDNIDLSLEQAVNGTLDVEAMKAQSAAKVQVQEDSGSAWQAQVGPYDEAIARKDYRAAIAHLEKLMDGNLHEGIWTTYRLNALMHVDETAGLAYARELMADGKFLKGFEYTPEVYGGSTAGLAVASALVLTANTDGFSDAVYRYGLECAQHSLKKYPNGTGAWAALAVAYQRLGKVKEAEEAQRQLVIAANRLGLPGEEKGRAIEEERRRVASKTAEGRPR